MKGVSHWRILRGMDSDYKTGKANAREKKKIKTEGGEIRKVLVGLQRY